MPRAETVNYGPKAKKWRCPDYEVPPELKHDLPAVIGSKPPEAALESAVKPINASLPLLDQRRKGSKKLLPVSSYVDPHRLAATLEAEEWSQEEEIKRLVAISRGPNHALAMRAMEAIRSRTVYSLEASGLVVRQKATMKGVSADGSAVVVEASLKSFANSEAARTDRLLAQALNSAEGVNTGEPERCLSEPGRCPSEAGTGSPTSGRPSPDAPGESPGQDEVGDRSPDGGRGRQQCSSEAAGATSEPRTSPESAESAESAEESVPQQTEEDLEAEAKPKDVPVGQEAGKAVCWPNLKRPAPGKDSGPGAGGSFRKTPTHPSAGGPSRICPGRTGN